MIVELKIELLPTPFATGPWVGLLEIDEQNTLEELHLAIQNAVDFDNDHMYEFFIAKAEFGQRTSFDLDSGAIYNTSINTLFNLGQGKKYFYLFDYGDEWLFEINKSPKVPTAELKGVKYPRLINEIGNKPQQYPNFDE